MQHSTHREIQDSWPYIVLSASPAIQILKTCCSKSVIFLLTKKDNAYTGSNILNTHEKLLMCAGVACHGTNRMENLHGWLGSLSTAIYNCHPCATSDNLRLIGTNTYAFKLQIECQLGSRYYGRGPVSFFF